MENFIEAIRNHNISNEPYALLIDGEWGTGKTYYITEEIIPKISKDDTKIVYFSVYGFNDFENLKQELMYKVINEISGSKIMQNIVENQEDIKKISEALNIFNLNKIPSTIFDYSIEKHTQKIIEKNDEKIILFIDDIERLNKSIDLNDLLGFILNTFIEQMKARVFYITNLNKIEKTNEKVTIKFDHFWEKSINRIIKFSYSQNEVKNIIIEKYNDTFIKNEIKWILQIFNEFFANENINLRTIFSIISNFIYIKTKINLPNESDSIDIYKSIFLNSLVITNEFKIGRIMPGNKNDLEILNDTRMFEIDFSKKASEDIVARKILNKYHKKSEHFDNFIFYNKDINNYIVHGFFEENDYVEIWDMFFNSKQQESIIESKRNTKKKFKEAYSEKAREEYKQTETKILEEKFSINDLGDYRRYTDEEFKIIQQNVLTSLQNGLYELPELFDILKYSSSLQKKNLLLIEEWPQILEEQFKEKLKQLNKLELDTYSKKIQHLSFHVSYREDQIFNNILKILEEIKEQEKHEFLERLIENLLNESDNKINESDSIALEVAEKQLHELNEIFMIILKPEFLNDFILVDNSKIYTLTNYITSKLLNVTYTDSLTEENIKDIKTLQTCVSNYYQEKVDSMDTIDKIKFNEFLIELQKLLDMYEGKF